MCSVDNRIGKYLSAYAIYRGKISTMEVDKYIYKFSDKNSNSFVDFIPDSISYSICDVAPNNINMAAC
jgi:tubulin beta